MYLNIMNNKKTGKTRLSIRRGYRNANGKVKNVTIQNLGDLDELKKQYDDPIAHFKDVVKQMNEEEKNNNKPLTVTIDKNEELEKGEIMEKKVVLITGGASGIGYGILKYLLDFNKYEIISVSKRETNIQTAKRSLKNDNVLFLQSDITNEAECQNIYDVVQLKYGKLDGLINCAGTIKLGGLEKQTLDEWNNSININLTAIFLLTKTLLPLLKNGIEPSIINISSIHSKKPGGSIAYCTSKAGVDMLTKFMAQELTKYKIRVNSINPAFVESNIYLSSGDYSETEYNNLVKERNLTYPLGRIGNAYNDIAPLAEFLLSDKSTWITGSNYVIDGRKNTFLNQIIWRKII